VLRELRDGHLAGRAELHVVLRVDEHTMYG
jgi:hypothetical protein